MARTLRAFHPPPPGPPVAPVTAGGVAPGGSGVVGGGARAGGASLFQRARFARGGIQMVPEEQIPYEGNWGRQNPEAFGQAYDGNGATLINDERALGARAAELANGLVPLDEIINRLDAYNKPPQLKQNAFKVFITAFATPFLLIPYNPRRLGLSIANYRIVPMSGTVGINGVMFSFGKPDQTAAGELAGFPLTPCYQETNGSVSVDAIYVFCNDDTQTLPIPVLGYEANIALGRVNPR